MEHKKTDDRPSIIGTKGSDLEAGGTGARAHAPGDLDESVSGQALFGHIPRLTLVS